MKKLLNALRSYFAPRARYQITVTRDGSEYYYTVRCKSAEEALAWEARLADGCTCSTVTRA